MKPIYLYGIIPNDQKIIFDEVCGMDDDDDEVYTWPFDSIAAVVGASPLGDYRGLKRDQAMRYLVTHQRVVEAVLAHFTVLPAKFGTLLPDLGHLERLMIQGCALFQRSLSNMAGLAQMEVVTLWNLQQVFQEIGQEEAVAQLKVRMAQHPAGQTLDERVAIGRLVKESLERRRTALGERIAPVLQALARDSVVNPTLDDSVVINLGLLLDDAGRAALDRTLAQLDQAFGGQFTFRSVGPLPPYSFATIEVHIPTFEMIDAARQLLGCGYVVGADEIKRAYYQAAKQAHPDLNSNGQEFESRMAALTQAYKLLVSVAETQALVLAGGDGRCSLARDQIDGTLLISVRRQEFNQQ